MARVTIELPDHLHKEIKQAARAENRSMHGEILHRLERKKPSPTFNDLKQGETHAAL